MKRFRLFHVIAILVSSLLSISITAPLANAQDKGGISGEQVDPQRLAAARKFLELSDFESQISEMLPAMLEQILDAVTEQPGAAPPDQQQQTEFREFSKLLTQAISNKFLEEKPKLIELTALVYARALTVEELKALTEFTLSPPGRKFNATLPEIMGEIVTAMVTGRQLPNSGSLNPEKQRAIKEMMEASQFERTLDLMLDQMAQPAPTDAFPPDISEQEIKEIHAESKAMIENFKSRKQEVNQFITSVWAKKLEVKELKTVTNFYQTALGQQIIEAMPTIFEEQEKLQQQMFTDMDTIIQEVIQKRQSQQ